jgi:hypothetical protein
LRFDGRSALVALLLSTSLFAQIGTDRGATPPVRLASIQGHPFWIDAREIPATPDVLLRHGYDEATVRAIQRVLQVPEQEGCIALGRSYTQYVNAPVRTDLVSALRSSEFVIDAIVTGKAYGFFGGTAGQLLRLSVKKLLAGHGGGANYFIFIPVGEFTVNGRRLCKSDPACTVVPAVGERVIVFAPRGYVSGQFVNIVDDGGLIGVGEGGVLTLPPRYASTAGAQDLPSLMQLLANSEETEE